jgi:hypothetical protein
MYCQKQRIDGDGPMSRGTDEDTQSNVESGLFEGRFEG